MIEKMFDSRVHDLKYRRRPQSKQQHRNRQHGQNKCFSWGDVLELSDIFVGNLTKNDTLLHPQCIGGTENQCQRSQEGNPETGLKTTENHQEFANEAGRARQT